MSPSHARRRGRIYRYYVAREATTDGYDSCTVTSVPAADIEGAVLDRVQKLLAALKSWRGPGWRRSAPSARSPSC
jgi:site-specific DNA recombinase